MVIDALHMGKLRPSSSILVIQEPQKRVGRMAQALVYLAVLSSRLRTDLEIQHPLMAGRRHCQR